MATRVASLYAEIGLKTDKLTSGLNQAKSGISKFGTDVKNQLSGVQKLGSGLNNAVTQLTGFNLAQIGAAGAVAFAAKQVGESIKFTQQYAEEVRTLSAATGMSNTETSKMIQLFDDAGVSTEAITAASRAMIQQGLAPSIDTIAKLADEFNSMTDPAAKGKLLLDNFGRSGLQMGKLLQMGSKAIRESGKEAERFGQVLDDKAIEAAEEYRIALDTMADAAEGVKIKIGMSLIPALADAANAMNNYISTVQEHAMEIGDLDEALKLNIITQEEYNAMVLETAKGTKIVVASEAELADVRAGLDEYTERLVDHSRPIPGIMKDVAAAEAEAAAAADKLAGGYSMAMEALQKSNVPLYEKNRLLDLLAIKAGKTTAEELEMERQINIVTLAYEAGALTIDEYQSKLDDVVNGIPYATTQTGNLTQGMKNLDSGVKGASDRVRELKRGIDELKNKTVTITVNLRGNIPTNASISDIFNREVGGPVKAGMPYVVGEKGPELFVPNTSGQIVPNNQLKSGGGGNSFGDINIFVEGGDPDATAFAVMSSFQEATRAAANSGLGFAG